MDTIKLTIDGRKVTTTPGKSVLDAALEAGIYIPHLCHHPDLPPIGGCRLCVVEIDGRAGLPPSCATPAENGMVVRTNTGVIARARRMAIELILAGHPPDCGTCAKYLNCELQSLKQYFSAEELRVRRRARLLPVNAGNPLFVHEPNKCVACGRCVRACRDLRGVGVLYYRKKDQETFTWTGADLPLGEAGCRFCGACAEVCPTGAIHDQDDLVRGKKRQAALVPCRYSCPAEIDVPRYVRYIRNYDYSAAAAVIREKVPFPRVLGYVCDRPCEDVCRRGEVNQAVSIRELKRFTVEHDNAPRNGLNAKTPPPTGKKVAVIGAGPAGLTAAYLLARQGHEVIVFEALPAAGGMLRYGIPAYRLPRDVIEQEIGEIEKMGVKITTGTRVESIEALLEQGFAAVLVTVGTHGGQRLRLPGADGAGVLIGTDLLREVNLGNRVDIGKNVVVIGGGNVAFDCARVARRLGAERVHVACLECRADMPAGSDEIEQGEAEGITVHPSRTASQILRADGRVTGVEFVAVASLLFDAENNPYIEIVEDSRHVIEADTVIFAIGQRPEVPPGFKLATGAGNRITVDPVSSATSLEGVFAAGDAVTGTSSVIQAIASGRKAAAAVDRFLGGSGVVDPRLAAPAELATFLGREEGFALENRCRDAIACPPDLTGNFGAVAGEMDEEAAAGEAGRCLQCDLRLKIARVKFWGDY
jgi:NADPH-dependent glutamate synthase beta subunit-like oxidoreductase/NAD-dependent dihydropyrimidine dehydrogenase PreA subunit